MNSSLKVIYKRGREYKSYQTLWYIPLPLERSRFWPSWSWGRKKEAGWIEESIDHKKLRQIITYNETFQVL